MAKRAAEVRAVRNLAGKLGRPQTTTIRGFRYVSTTYRADGSARVVVEYVKPRPSKPILIKKHQKMPHRRHWYRRIR